MNPTAIIPLITEFLEFANEASAFFNNLQGVFLQIWIFFKKLAQLLRAFLEDSCNVGNLCLHLFQLFLVHDACEASPSLDEFCILQFIILLIFEQFADFESSQLAADVVLRFDVIEELERLGGLLDQNTEFVVVRAVHKLYKQCAAYGI